MRRILVETARRKGRAKHGGGRRRQPADLDTLVAGESDEDLLAMHEALGQLAAHDPVKAQLVELRFFAGLTLEQAAACLDISPPAPTGPGATPAPGCTPPWPAMIPSKRLTA
jgi:hypothetical protein